MDNNVGDGVSVEYKHKLLFFVFGFCFLCFVVLIVFSIYNLYNTLAPSWDFDAGYVSNMPNIYGSCSRFGDNYELLVTIDNYKKEIRNLKCEIFATGGLVADKEEAALSFISPNSFGSCLFVLNGELSGSVLARVTYSLKGFWGSRDFSTMVDIYPSCSDVSGDALWDQFWEQ